MERLIVLHNDNQIRCEIVKSLDRLTLANAVKAICFVEEHGMTSSLIYDGNDLQATHFLALAGDEPIGTVRVRWFHDFAKYERASIRQKWRNPRVMKMLAEFAFEHVARKGYSRVITHASPRYASVWKKLLGFELVDKEPCIFEDHDEPYVELQKTLVVPGNAITLSAPVATLFRVEGEWDQPSAHEVR
jgi:hypothetical protein